MDVKMVPKTYTARELLRMRRVFVNKELYSKLLDKVHKDVDLGEIFRMSPDRVLPLIEEEPSDTKIEVHESRTMEEGSVRQLDGTDAEWKYRGRTDSEHGEHQPIGAPAGLSAQKDEGFQRFYKAVVSPTHVRVTAGGRIVPNTRGSCSPTAKWTKERIGGESTYSQRPAIHNPGDMPAFHIPALPHSPFVPFPPMVPGFVPGMPGGMASPHQHPMSMMPWQMGVGLGSPFNMLHPAAAQMQPIKPASRTTEASEGYEKQGGSINSENISSVRISPPENFDPGRPFIFNGQYVMPTGGSFFPYGMAPLTGFPIPGLPSTTVLPPRFAVPAMMQSFPTKLTQSQHSQIAATSTAPKPGQVAMPISSIRPSEITKKQIEVLRSSLRYFEDQLQYNKHQIDEKGMENQARVVRQQIQQFQDNLKLQIQSEQAHYTKSPGRKDGSDSPAQDDGITSTTSTSLDTKADSNSRQASTSHTPAPHTQTTRLQNPPDRLGSRQPSALKSIKSVSAPVSAKTSPETSEDNEPIKKLSTLPVSAALAPPFHPRVESTSSVPLPAIAHISSGSSTEDTAYGQAVTEGNSESCSSGSFAEKPYLVGRLSEGINLNATNHPGYSYSRDLTEDELRARHMYWGNTPRDLQKGLPKFDGKDFYPPSPVKLQTPVSAKKTILPSQPIPIRDLERDYKLMDQNTPSDPFRSLGRSNQRPPRSTLGPTTQSEHLTDFDQTCQPCTHGKHGAKLGTGPTCHSYTDFRKAMEETASSSSDVYKDKSSDDGDDSSSILFRGRKYMSSNSKNRNEIWKTLWKRNKSNISAVPGTVSSMTARAVLPNYAGHATASLTPAIANASISPKGSASKHLSVDGLPIPKAGHVNAENRPPCIPGV